MQKFRFRVGHIQWNILLALSDLLAGTDSNAAVTVNDIRGYIGDQERAYQEYFRSLKLLSEQGLVSRPSKARFRLTDLGYKIIAYSLTNILKQEMGRNVGLQS